MVLNACAFRINGPSAMNTGILEIRKVLEKFDDFVAFAAIVQFGCVDFGPAACGRENKRPGVDVWEAHVEGVEVCYCGDGFVAAIC